MGTHLHKRFTKSEVIEVFERYLGKEIEVEHANSMLGIGRSRFFDMLKEYRQNPDKFSLEYKRRTASRKISDKVEKKILKELKRDCALIKDKRNPIRDYNYSFIRDALERKHGTKVSLSTIIRRAKKMGFISRRRSKEATIGKF